MPTLDQTTIQAQDHTGTRIVRYGRYTGPASYATGGDPLTPANVAMGKIDVMLTDNPSDGTTIYLTRYDHTNAKMKWFDLAGAEVAAAVNLSTFVLRYMAIGK